MQLLGLSPALPHLSLQHYDLGLPHCDLYYAASYSLDFSIWILGINQKLYLIKGSFLHLRFSQKIFMLLCNLKEAISYGIISHAVASLF